MSETSKIERLGDWAVGVVSPRRAAIRAHFRRMARDPEYQTATMLGMRLMGYRAAGESGSKTPWFGGSSSADAEILRDLPNLRNRSRELNRDDPVASGITNTFVSNVIGPGIVAQARTGDTEKNKRVESVWKERKDKLNPVDDLLHAEAQALLLRKVFEDGDVLQKATKLSAQTPVWFETIEADRLATPTSLMSSTRDIRDGVERDAFGRPTRYHILKKHPGDTMSGFTATTESDFRVRDASVVKHLKLVKRPGQTRGVPAFHAILQDLRDLDLLILASLKRSQIAACLAVFIKSPTPANELFDATADRHGYKLDQRIEPGMIFKLNPEEEVQTLIPNFPMPEFTPFIVMLARRIGAALGVSWQVVLKDFSDSTYSSARTDLLETRIVYTTLQKWFIDKYLRWEWRIVMDDAVLRGDPRMAGVASEEIDMVNWIPPGWKWVDPLKEAKATEVELAIGTTTLQTVCAAKGLDWEELAEQRAIEQKKLEELGLPVPFGAKVNPAPDTATDDDDDT